jgi:hypothetical protein
VLLFVRMGVRKITLFIKGALKNTDAGVPHGSLLGPTLYNLYTKGKSRQNGHSAVHIVINQSRASVKLKDLDTLIT